MSKLQRNPGFGARSQTMAAALAVSAAEPATSDAATPEAEPVKGISLRLPLSMWKQVSTLSHERQLAKGAEKRKRGDADEDSIHGIILTALGEYLANS